MKRLLSSPFRGVKFCSGAVWLCVSLLLLSGCQKDAGVDEPSTIIRVPLTRQSKNYTCGVACVQSILGYHGISIREGQIADDMGVTEFACPPLIIPYMEGMGFTVKAYSSMTVDKLRAQIDNGLPVMVAIQAWQEPYEKKPIDFYIDRWDCGHWVIVVGYRTSDLIFMDPSTLGNYTYMSVAEFLNRWHDEYTLPGQPTVRAVQYGLTFEGLPASYRPGEFDELN